MSETDDFTERLHRFAPYPSADLLRKLGENVTVRATVRFWAHNPDLDLEGQRSYVLESVRYVRDTFELPIGEAAAALIVSEQLVVATATAGQSFWVFKDTKQ